MATTSTSGIPVYADTAALSRLSRNLRAASKEVWKTYKASAAKGAEVVLEDAQSRAPSQRVANSGSVKVGAGGNPKIVFTAPNAAPIENKGKGFVRHPTYSPRPDVDAKVGWTDLNSHPAFAAPALAAHGAQVAALVETAITDAVGHVIGL